MAANLTELILDRAHNAAVAMDERGLVTYWNPSAEHMFGISRPDALGRAVAELIVPDRLRAAHVEGLRRFLDTGAGPVLDRRIELTALKADGHEFPVEITISAFRQGERWRFHAFIQDITQRREAEHEHDRLIEELRNTLRGTERRFEAVVGSLSDPVTIRDRQHRFLYANRSALSHLGFDSWEQLRETPPAEIMKDYVVEDENGGEVAMDDIPSVRLLRGEPAEPLLIRTVHRDTHVERWNLLKAAPLLDEHGEIEATITIIENVTERRRAELRSAFLAQASAQLASSLDYEQTLRNVAELAVPDIADWCAVDLIDDDGDTRTVAVAHSDPRRIHLAEELRRYTPESRDSGQGIGRVLRTGEALLYPEISEEMLVQSALDERHLQLLREVGARSALVVPMRVGRKTLGAMTLVSSESARLLGQVDLELAEQTAARAATAIENSRLYSERSMIARTLQQSLLPEELPQIPGYELGSLYLPAFQATMVGGDFYDIWSVEEHWFMTIGDVTGKGIQAAALTSLVRHTLRTGSEFGCSPAQLLALVDRALKRRPTLSVCTAMCLRLDGADMTLAVAGHPLPLRISGQDVEELGDYGPLLGAFTEVSWQDSTCTLQSGSTLVAYTDGVTDARGRNGERFGLRRLRQALEELRERPAAEVIARLAHRLETFQSGAHTDDTAVIVLHRLASGEPAGTRKAARRARRGATISTPA